MALINAFRAPVYLADAYHFRRLYMATGNREHLEAYRASLGLARRANAGGR